MNLRTLALAAMLAVPGAALADHTYQVTGPVVSSNADSITVKKGSENWEIARGEDKTDVKTGDRRKPRTAYWMSSRKASSQDPPQAERAASSTFAALPESSLR